MIIHTTFGNSSWNHPPAFEIKNPPEIGFRMMPSTAKLAAKAGAKRPDADAVDPNTPTHFWYSAANIKIPRTANPSSST